MFKTKHAQRLEEEPITVNINEKEQFTLRPMSLDSLPTKQDSLHVFHLMESNNDFNNFIPFLRGLWMSDIRLSTNRWEYLIRKAARAGKLNLILECARQEPHTGLSLDKINLARRFFYELHVLAQEADFKGPATAQALRLAETAVRTMDWNDSSEKRVEPTKNPKNQPFVIGTLLELSAARSINDLGGKDENSEVLKYVNKLLASWRFGQFEPVVTKESRRRETLDRWLQEILPIFNGMRLSLSVESVTRDKTLHSSVTLRLVDLKKAISKELESLPEGKTTQCIEAAKALVRE